MTSSHQRRKILGPVVVIVLNLHFLPDALTCMVLVQLLNHPCDCEENPPHSLHYSATLILLLAREPELTSMLSEYSTPAVIGSGSDTLCEQLGSMGGKDIFCVLL